MLKMSEELILAKMFVFIEFSTTPNLSRVTKSLLTKKSREEICAVSLGATTNLLAIDNLTKLAECSREVMIALIQSIPE